MPRRRSNASACTRREPGGPVLLECEIKFRLDTAADALRLLAAAGVDLSVPEAEENAVLDTPEGSLSNAGILLRIRSTAGRTFLTVKTPVESDRMKIRNEMETVADCPSAQLEEMFASLGFRVARRYSKIRRTGSIGGAVICLDELPFGVFVEIEARSPEGLELAAGRLGLDVAAGLRESYLELEAGAGRGG